MGLRRTSHSGLVFSATSEWRGRDHQASGGRFLSVLSGLPRTSQGNAWGMNANKHVVS